MLALIFALLVYSARATNDTSSKLMGFRVPPLVFEDQTSVDILCTYYKVNFTILNMFKGSHEFFRYRPSTVPHTKLFSLLGVGKIEVISCNSIECHLRLSELTEEASGTYRCDLERDKPPYKFYSKKSHMQVYRHPRRTPIVVGLAEEFGKGDLIRAMCSAEKDADIRWYLNGEEVVEQRGSISFMLESNIVHFEGIERPSIAVQCAESIGDTEIGSREVLAYWKGAVHADETENSSCAPESKNNSNSLRKFEEIMAFLLVQNLILNF